jgi:hypothetical protein
MIEETLVIELMCGGRVMHRLITLRGPKKYNLSEQSIDLSLRIMAAVSAITGT